MKKKFITVMAAAGMALAVTACSSSDKTETAAAEETTAAESTAEESTSEAEAGEIETDADGETLADNEKISQTSQDGMQVKITSVASDEAVSDDGKTMLSGTFDTVEIVDDGYDMLKHTLKVANEDAKKAYDEEYASNLDFVKEFVQDSADDTAESSSDETEADDMDISYSMSNLVVLSRCDDDVFSFTRTDDSFLGGAHPNSYVFGYNYDTDDGKELKLSDVVTDYAKTEEYVLAELEKKNTEEDYQLFEDYKDTVDGLFNGTSANANDTDAGGSYSESAVIQWTMTDDSIQVFFNKYDIAPYAAGLITVEIPVSSGLLSPNYFEIN